MMRIGFGTLFDPRDEARGSGTAFFLSRELERQGHLVHFLGPIGLEPVPLSTRVLKKMATISGKRFRSSQNVAVARRIGAKIRAKIAPLDLDVVLTNDYAIAGYSGVECPSVLYTDYVFPRQYTRARHPWWFNLSRSSVRSCQQVTKRGLLKAALCAFPSDWAVESAIEYSPGLIGAKCQRIEFGANFFAPPDSSQIERRLESQAQLKGGLEILFIGNRDWQLKGGDVAVEATRLLRSRGIAASLHLVGATPPYPLADPWIKSYGVLHKRRDSETLEHLFRNSDVMLTPTRAEGFGIAFVEAAAYGIPSLSFDSGTGTNNAVRHEQTGLLLPLGSEPEEFARVIHSWLERPDDYHRLARGARSYYQGEANWTVAVERLVSAIDERLQLEAA